MPATTTMPIEKRLAAPAPLAISSGTSPTTIAAVVIRIGRSRTRAACSIAAPAVEPFADLQLVGEGDHQDAVLADQSDQGDEPDLGVDVHRREAEEQRHHRAADRHRHADQDHQRIAQALELRRQHQEDDDQGEDEGDGQLIALRTYWRESER